MKIFKISLKAIMAICFIVGLTGCEIGHPVPPEAFKRCYEKGGSPLYKSNHNGTRFVCLKPGFEIEGNF
ncbi:hypothetical protein KAR91_33310 [Candidatus Pacearchaeota archaeon]|nr:hypothetical protein [Candidatus Pacearchaeota archaeon]